MSAALQPIGMKNTQGQTKEVSEVGHSDSHGHDCCHSNVSEKKHPSALSITVDLDKLFKLWTIALVSRMGG